MLLSSMLGQAVDVPIDGEIYEDKLRGLIAASKRANLSDRCTASGCSSARGGEPWLALRPEPTARGRPSGSPGRTPRCPLPLSHPTHPPLSTGSARRFPDAPREYGLMPFWGWNDDLSEAELLRQVREMHAGGFGGFVPHADLGLPRSIGYLTDEYFRLLRLAVDEAARLGLKVILYDEGYYPSGSARAKSSRRTPTMPRAASSRWSGPSLGRRAGSGGPILAAPSRERWCPW